MVEVDVDFPSVLSRLGLDDVSGPFSLIAGAGVEEYTRSVSTHDEAVVERLAQVVLELLGVEALGQRTCVALLVHVDLKAPIIIHGAVLSRSRYARLA